MTWEQTAEVLAREVYRLQKENDRLKEFVHEVAHVNVADFSDGWKALVEFARVGRGLISPAAEGGGAANGGESKPLVCHEMTAEETAEAAEIIRKAWEGVPKDIPIGGFEGLESASKAIVGGESQALQDKLVEENQILRDAILDEDRVHIKIEKKLNKAIQSAILGLHTLAGEFPTPTWKTREDYLQATISEINEILGKQ